MNNVINFNDKKPHLYGTAICLHCNHTWEAVAPIGATEYECPECGLFKGVPQGLCISEVIAQCNCGCQHFYRVFVKRG